MRAGLKKKSGFAMRGVCGGGEEGRAGGDGKGSERGGVGCKDRVENLVCERTSIPVSASRLLAASSPL